MHLKKDELTILYNSANARDRNTVTYAKTVTSKINKQDINSVDVSATFFRLIFDKLGDVKKIINKSNRYYQEVLKGSELAPKMWFMALKKQPELLRAPVVYYKGKIVICDSPTDVLKIHSSVTA